MRIAVHASGPLILLSNMVAVPGDRIIYLSRHDENYSHVIWRNWLYATGYGFLTWRKG